MKDITKRYDAGDITIVWQPAKCIHAGECVKALPNVYKPNEKPWLSPENANADELRAQIKLCPSGALSFEENISENATKNPVEYTKIQVRPNGPLLCHGSVEVTNSNGEVEMKENITAFCRCGASQNKPYCDGGHNKIGFEG